MKITKLIELLNKSHSQFHVVNEIRTILKENGFIELSETQPFLITEGKNYYVVRNNSSIIAFKTPQKCENIHFQIAASHTDSPTFKLKREPIFVSNGSTLLNVEPYGGSILSTWLDRPLSIAGRLVVKKDDMIKTVLVDIDKDLLVIPNVAIHLNRAVNDGFKYNPAVDMIPLLTSSITSLDDLFNSYKNEIQYDEILGHDLYLYNRDMAKTSGLNDEFLSSPRIDNLTSVYSSLYALINSKNAAVLNFFVAFDNEEVGSKTRQGAGSTFLKDVIERVCDSLKISKEEYHQAVAKSSLLSIDNGHATHPNHPELSDKNKVILGKGPIIKFNSSESYTSNGLSSSIVNKIAKNNDISIQYYENRSDIRGGSTLGNISISQVSILSVDIGIPQLAMHSANELCAISDIESIYKIELEYFNSNIEVLDDQIKFN